MGCMVSRDAVIAKSERDAELAKQMGLDELAAELRADTRTLRQLGDGDPGKDEEDPPAE